MDRYRVRIRFRKEGDLRLTSHRDLVRAFERMFRRANLNLRMSEGFHPKARMSFPSALSLGIAGSNESMDVELAEPADTTKLQQTLADHAPPGLTIQSVRALASGESKVQVARLRYAIELPESRVESTTQAAVELMALGALPIQRDGRVESIDARAGIAELNVCEGELEMTLIASREASVRPREVLEALEIDDLESFGLFLRRTAVESAHEH